MSRLLSLAIFLVGAVSGCLFHSAWSNLANNNSDAVSAVELTLTSFEAPTTHQDAKAHRTPKLGLVPSPQRSDGARRRPADARVPLTDKDRAMIAFQKKCPVCSKSLDPKKLPARIELTLYLCGKECTAQFEKQPRDAITKWAEICSIRTKEVTPRPKP